MPDRRHDGLSQSLLNMLHLVCSDGLALSNHRIKVWSFSQRRGRSSWDDVTEASSIERVQAGFKIPGADSQSQGNGIAAQVPSPAFLSAICAIISLAGRETRGSCSRRTWPKGSTS